MENPTTCPECLSLVETDDLVDTIGKLCYHNLVCPDCYDILESDDDDFDE